MQAGVANRIVGGKRKVGLSCLAVGEQVSSLAVLAKQVVYVPRLMCTFTASRNWQLRGVGQIYYRMRGIATGLVMCACGCVGTANQTPGRVPGEW